MDRRPNAAFQINPYTRWVYDHPERLLPEPTPALLAAARRSAATPGKAEASGGLEVDLGCGSGNFLLQLAARHPERHYVGFELRFKRLVKAARKLEQAGCANVWLVREAAERFGNYFGDGSVDCVHVNFPDPWPRPSQWKKRLIGQRFLDELSQVLKPGGELRLKTDHAGYFLHSLAVIHRQPGWRLSQFANDLHRGLPRVWQCHGDRHRDMEANLESEFEQLFRSKHKPVHYLSAEKVEAAGTAGLRSP